MRDTEIATPHAMAVDPIAPSPKVAPRVGGMPARPDLPRPPAEQREGGMTIGDERAAPTRVHAPLPRQRMEPNTPQPSSAPAAQHGVAPAPAVNLALFDNIAIQAQVMLGQVSLSIGQLMHMREGEVVATDRLLSQPVDVIVNGTVVARGELVAAGEHFGVRITDIAQHEAA